MNDEQIFVNKVKDIFAENQKIFLLQIGANDGVMADPVHDLIINDVRISAMLIEPQKEVFSSLQKNYDIVKDRVKFLNVAITKENGEVKLFKNTDPLGSSGHASLLLRQNEYATNFAESMYELVDGINVSTLLKNVQSFIDVLVIDTEGYDIEILKQFIEQKVFPKIIFFERPYPSPGNDRLNIVETGNQVLEDMINKLNSFNYDIEVFSGNVLCVKKDVFC